MIKTVFISIADVLGSVFFWLCVNWWAPLFASNDGWLPNWLAWAQTFDADLDTGAREGMVTAKTQYWQRVQWLNRNCAYGWSYWALGMPFVPSQWRVVTHTGDERAPDFTFYAVDINGNFNLHCNRWGMKFKIGYKSWNYFTGSLDDPWKKVPWGPVWRVPFVFSVGRNN